MDTEENAAQLTAVAVVVARGVVAIVVVVVVVLVVVVVVVVVVVLLTTQVTVFEVPDPEHVPDSICPVGHDMVQFVQTLLS